MTIPNWVSDGSVRKYHRAVAKLRSENKEITEEAVRNLYENIYKGLVIEKPIVDEVEEAPVRRGRRAA